MLLPLNPLRGLEAVTHEPVVDWIEANVYLSPRVPTATPGQWRRQTVPAICAPGGPLECLDDPDVESVSVCKGGQTTLTTTAYAWLAYCQANDPGSALVVMNSTQDARDKSAETWRPIWEDSPRLKRYLPHSRRKDWTKLYQLTNRSPVYWIGANSPGRLAAKPIRRLILDEECKYPDSFGGGKIRKEAGAVELAMQRVKTFRQKGLAKILRISTPTNDAGSITVAYEDGDKRKLHVRCHACRNEQVMVWAAFKVDMDLAKRDPGAAVAGAHYACPHCRSPWTDAQRYRAIEGGAWKATQAPRDPRARSLWFPSWNSTMVTHAYLAAQWIKAQGNPSALQDFINSECGEPFVSYENMLRDEQFAMLEGGYREGEDWLAADPYSAQYPEPRETVVIMGCDVQKGYLVAVARRFMRGGDSGLLWQGQLASFADLDAKADLFGASWVFVDQRYRTREVQEWCETHSGYIPCLGVSRKSRTLYTVQLVDLDEGKRGQGRSGRVIESLHHDPDMLKDLLAEEIQRGDNAHRWMIPQGYSGKAEYVAHMTAERCINGQWVNLQHRANHAWDAEALALLGAIRMGYYYVAGMQSAEGPEGEP